MTAGDLLHAIASNRPDWWAAGACRGSTVDLFFPERGETVKRAKAVCAGCSVRAACLEFDLYNCIQFGVWGQTSERERRRLRVGRKPQGRPSLPIAHGTPAGYATHRRRGLTPGIRSTLRRVRTVSPGFDAPGVGCGRHRRYRRRSRRRSRRLLWRRREGLLLSPANRRRGHPSCPQCRPLSPVGVVGRSTHSP